jgi:gas vesicle protein
MDNSNRVVWFLTGAALGAAVALLYAPQSGRDTRRYITKKARKSGEAISDTGRELFEKGRKMADDAADLFERGRRLVEG